MSDWETFKEYTKHKAIVMALIFFGVVLLCLSSYFGLAETYQGLIFGEELSYVTLILGIILLGAGLIIGSYFKFKWRGER